jgi:ribokinase
MSQSIFVIGSSNTDMVVRSKRIPQKGETILGGDFFMFPGGKGANQAVAAARLGGHVTFVANLGNDLFGENALRQFEQEGIHTGFISHDAVNPSGVALISVDESGENSIVVASGANNFLAPAQVEAALEYASPQSIVLIQLESPIETVAATARMAKQKNLQLILNPAPAAKLSDEILGAVSVITPNETEAALLTGISVTDERSAAKAADFFHQRKISSVIITMGSQGAYVSSEKFTGIVPVQKIIAVDTTAAGDCFNGALAVALAEGLEMDRAVQFANAAASISVTRMGAQASMPKRNEINFQ